MLSLRAAAKQFPRADDSKIKDCLAAAPRSMTSHAHRLRGALSPLWERFSVLRTTSFQQFHHVRVTCRKCPKPCGPPIFVSGVQTRSTIQGLFHRVQVAFGGADYECGGTTSSGSSESARLSKSSLATSAYPLRAALIRAVQAVARWR